MMEISDVRETPIVEVHLDNYTDIWPSLILAVKSSTFVAIDTELSGLGDRKLLSCKSVEDRYKACVDSAQTRSIISLGLSCFRRLPTEPRSDSATSDSASTSGILAHKFVAQTFNILVLCSENYVVEPQSLKFLVEHSFDFNRQYSSGLPYTRGNDKEGGGSIPQVSLRQLFVNLVQARVPIVLHNAFIDLVFLYESLYASLPSNQATFLTDLSRMFSAGVYDTKYIAEFEMRMKASYLEYTFRKSQRENASRRMSRSYSYADIIFLSYPASMQQNVVMAACGLHDQPCTRDVGKTLVCMNYAGHGWCQKGVDCPMSHDVDLILDAEDWVISRKKKKRSRRTTKDVKTTATSEHAVTRTSIGENGEKSSQSDSDQSQGSLDTVAMALDVKFETPIEKMHIDDHGCSHRQNENVDSDQKSSHNSESKAGGIQDDLLGKMVRTSVNRISGHRAGFDAFMTGYIFASFFAQRNAVREQFELGGDAANKIYLGGKDFPLQILQSNFAKPSRSHAEKWARIIGTGDFK